MFKFDFRKAVIPIFGNSYGDQSAVFVGSGLAVGSKSCLAAISIKIPFEKRVTPLLLLRAVGTEGQGGVIPRVANVVADHDDLSTQ